MKKISKLRRLRSQNMPITVELGFKFLLKMTKGIGRGAFEKN